MSHEEAQANFIRPALYWEKEPGGSIVQCKLCPWNCRIKHEKFGYCGVRLNRAGELFTTIYGVVSSKAVDPIEKKPLFHFYPGSSVYSLGTLGCNMRCKHCQNWEIAHARVESYFYPVEYLPPEEAVSEALEAGSKGIALTYNEPTIWIEYAFDLFKLAKEKGLYTAFVTNGFINPEPLKEISEYLDAYRVDIKGFREESYMQIAGLKRYKAVYEACYLAYHDLKLHVELVTNIIPGVNDSEEDLRSIARWIKNELGPEVPWHVTRFYPYLGFSRKYPTPIETLHLAYRIGYEEGLYFVYTGNVPGDPGENTYCPECRRTVIKREGFYVVEKHTENGHCAYCGFDLNIVE